MDILRKVFLFVVGITAIAYEETSKSVAQATKSIEEQREKLNKRITRAGA